MSSRTKRGNRRKRVTITREGQSGINEYILLTEALAVPNTSAERGKIQEHMQEEKGENTLNSNLIAFLNKRGASINTSRVPTKRLSR
jgi:hypothetical protein